MAPRIGDLLTRDNIITPAELERALAYQADKGGRLGSCLVAMGLCTEAQIVDCLSRQYGVPVIEPSQLVPDRELSTLVPRAVAERHQLLPLRRDGVKLSVAISDPTNVVALNELKFITGLTVDPWLASETELLEAIGRLYDDPGSDRDRLREMMDSIDTDELDQVEIPEAEAQSEIDLERAAEEAPVVRLVNALLSEAVQREASDIHLECYETEFRARYRIDGMLQQVMSLPLQLRDPVISRIKIMARLDISEKRMPQDGRIMLRLARHGRRQILDLRVSTLPTLFGEKIVLRLLDKDKLRLDMTHLGFDPDPLARFQEAIKQPYGMVLVTGPTGSGKTNTLYSAIVQLNTPQTNIMTAEDPVEFQLPGINQVQTKEQIGLTFAVALRSFLRQDPNIILVGEIRDAETAEIAVKAALTGHLVLSTLHTNDAASAITRLVNMGVEPFLVATSINLICAQRLVRRVCQHCRQPYPNAARELVELGLEPDLAASAVVYKAKGCTACNQTGYRGRVGLFEVMTVDEPIKERVLAGGSSADLKRLAIENGLITLRQSGLRKVAVGLTTLEEVVRETKE